jgi:hypothetical protein
MYVMALNSVSKAYFINPSHQPVCLYVYPFTVARQSTVNFILSVVARQRFCKHVLHDNECSKTISTVEHLCLFISLCVHPPIFVCQRIFVGASINRIMHILNKFIPVYISYNRIYFNTIFRFISLQASNSYIKQYSNQSGLSEYNSGVRLPLPT